MPADQLCDDVVDGIGDIEATRLRSDLRLEDALEQHVAQFAFELVGVSVVDGFDRLVRFFEKKGPQGFRRLLAVPGTTVARSQRGHDPDEACEGACGAPRGADASVVRGAAAGRGLTRAMLHSSSVRVLFLGTGTSHGVPMIGCDCDVCRSTDPRDSRSRPSIAIECDDGLRVLVDTTPDLRAQALRHDLRRIDAILTRIPTPTT